MSAWKNVRRGTTRTPQLTDAVKSADMATSPREQPTRLGAYRTGDLFDSGGVEVSIVGDVESGAKTVFDREPLNKVLFLYVVTGKVEIELSDAGKVLLAAAEVFVVFPGRTVSIRTLARKNRVMFAGLYGAQAVRAALALGYWDLFRAHNAFEGNFTAELIARFRESPLSGRDPQVLRDTERLLDTVWQRLRHASGRMDFYDAVKVLNTLPFDRFTTDEAAVTLGISRTKLNTLLEANGLGRPGQYLAHNRYMIAMAMLFFTHTATEQIAARLGFSSASSFGVFFRQHGGRTPGDFRKCPIPASSMAKCYCR